MGIIVMLAISVVAFRRARLAGRSATIWILMVWLWGPAIGSLGAIFGGIVSLVAVGSDTTDPPLAAVLSMAIGNVVGSALAAGFAGRPIRR